MCPIIRRPFRPSRKARCAARSTCDARDTQALKARSSCSAFDTRSDLRPREVRRSPCCSRSRTFCLGCSLLTPTFAPDVWREIFSEAYRCMLTWQPLRVMRCKVRNATPFYHKSQVSVLCAIARHAIKAEAHLYIFLVILVIYCCYIFYAHFAHRFYYPLLSFHVFICLVFIRLFALNTAHNHVYVGTVSIAFGIKRNKLIKHISNGVISRNVRRAILLYYCKTKAFGLRSASVANEVGIHFCCFMYPVHAKSN